MAEGHNPDATIKHDAARQAANPKVGDTTEQTDEERYIKNIWPRRD